MCLGKSLQKNKDPCRYVLNMMQIKGCFSLSHMYLLQGNSQYSDIFIVPDRTKFERKKHKKLVEELKERRS